METNLAADGGSVRLIDFMPIREDVAALVRIVEGVEGTCQLRMDLRLRSDYGTMLPWTEVTDRRTRRDRRVEPGRSEDAGSPSD